MRKWNNQLLDEWISEHRPNAKRIGEYDGALKKILMQCECGNQWMIDPAHFKHGVKCPKCNPTKRNNQLFDEWISEHRPNAKRIGEYINNREKILMQCECGNQWMTRPTSFMRGSQCYECRYRKVSNTQIKTHEEFVAELIDINPNIAVIETYTGARNKILCQCKICKSWWMAVPYHLTNQKSGCPICAGNQRKDTETYSQECDFLGFEVLEEYTNRCTRIKHKCKICGTEFIARPDNIIARQTGCPVCKKSKSRGEQFISTWLKNNNIKFKEEYRIDYNNHKHFFDFYIPSLNTFIEYDGRQHYKSVKYWGGEEKFQKQQERDAEKNQWCSDNGYELIRIKYDIPFEEVA